jgi:hypothetical protein
MNGLDEFAEAAVALFVVLCVLMMLLTRLESTLDQEPASKPQTTPGGQADEVTATASEVDEDSQ